LTSASSGMESRFSTNPILLAQEASFADAAPQITALPVVLSS
jgi:hypothetical protein